MSSELDRYSMYPLDKHLNKEKTTIRHNNYVKLVQHFPRRVSAKNSKSRTIVMLTFNWLYFDCIKRIIQCTDLMFGKGKYTIIRRIPSTVIAHPQILTNRLGGHPFVHLMNANMRMMSMAVTKTIILLPNILE